MTQDQFELITADPAICHGQPTIAGTRVTMSVVLDRLAAGTLRARCFMRYEFLLDDGSLFVVPAPWREVYERYFGATDAAEPEARLRFVVGKYMEHEAIPGKFDGIGVTAEGDARYDDPACYAETWDDQDA